MIRYIQTLAILSLLFVLVHTAQAQQAVPPLTGRVVDTANILSDTIEQTLTMMLAAHEDSTSNQVAVLTVPSLGGESIEDFSLRVAETWELGQAGTDNGVLLLVAVDDREMRIEVGYGLEGSLTDAAAGRIIRNEMAPQFRNGDYDMGVLLGVQSILGTIDGTYIPTEANSFDGDSPPFWFGLLFLLFPTLFLFPVIFQPWYVRLFIFLFMIPFMSVGGWALIGNLTGAIVVSAFYGAALFLSGLHPKVRAIQKKVKAARKTGSTVKVGPFSVGGASSSSGGGWSSGGSSFSGGGGSFGGGGASGGW